MSNIISSTKDGHQSSGIVSHATGWDAAHDNVGAGSPTITEVNTAFFGPRAQTSTSRGGIFFITRCFFDFNLSSITDNITAAVFKANTNTNGGHDAIVVKSGHDPSSSTDDWFSTWLTGQGITLSGWSSSDVTAYSSATTVASHGNSTNYTLNSSAITQLNSLRGTSNLFKIALLNHDFDYLDVVPTSTQLTGISFAEESNSARRPTLSLTLGTAAFGHDVITVPSGNIGKINTVVTANVGKVNTVD